MRNFRSTNDRSFGERNRDDRSFGRGNYGETHLGPKAMYPATCNKCGRDCQVPFRPNGRKPVLCSDCFRDANATYTQRTDDRFTQRQNPSFRSSPKESNKDNNYPAYKEQFEALNSKLDKILSILTPNEQIIPSKKTSPNANKNPKKVKSGQMVATEADTKPE